jgi:hypothetical protein
LGCIRCHAGNVLQPIDDWARKNYTVGKLALLVPSSFKDLDKDKQFKLYEDLKRQYLSDLKSVLDNDRENYQRAVIAACGVDASELAKRFSKAYHGYADVPVGPEQAARELGCTVEEMRATFIRFVVAKGAIDPELGGLLGAMEVVEGKVKFVPNVQPEWVNRLHWEELYPLAQKMMAGDLRD